MFAFANSTSSMSRRLVSVVLVALTSLSLAACTGNSAKSTTSEPSADKGQVREFTLEAYLSGYKGVGGAIDGQVNPDLNVEAGDTVKLTLIDKENMAHDFTLESSGEKTDTLMKVNERATLTFTAKANDTYFCSLPGHRAAGMEGKIVVAGGTQPTVAANTNQNSFLPGRTTQLKPARKVTTDEIGLPATAVPPPLERKANKKVEFTIETKEVVAEVEDGTTYEMWTYNGQVPGPFLRVKEGDTVVVNVDNDPDSTMSHSIDFHAVTGPGGGAAVLQVPPGERRSLQFKALKAGLFVYHCATPHIATHLARGMYGMILVEPKEGLKPVDHEYYVMQGEYYTAARPGTHGHQVEDADRLFEELPTYVVYNGRVGSLTGERAMKAKVGETVRIFFGVGGPNTRSSFHMIGEIIDRLYTKADLVDPPLHNIQTTLVPPGGATVAEIELEYPGKYLLVDHSLTRLDKGAVGILEVEGDADDTIYKSLDGLTPGGH